MSAKRQSRFGANVVGDVEKRKRESSGYGYLNLPKGLAIFKEEEGKLKIDIIPYYVTDEHHLDRNADDEFAANVGNPWYKKPVWVHRSVGADKQSVICPAKTIGKKCPICEYRDKQKAEGVEKDDQVSYPQQRNIYIIIPIGSKKFDEKFHIWDIANGNFQKVLDEELGDHSEYGAFPDPEEGKTLSVRFTEEKFGKNKYFSASRIDFEDRDAYDDDIMEKAPCIDDMVKILTYKELSALFLEIDPEDIQEEKSEKKEKEEEVSSFRKKKTVVSEEEEEETKPKRKPPVEETDDLPKRKPKPKEEEQEEQEEEEKPRSRRPAPVEEEEEKPTLRRRPAPKEEEQEEEDLHPQKKRRE